MSAALEIRQDHVNYFYPMSVIKLIVMMLCTLGLYSVCWWYNNWNSIKKTEQSGLSPALRSVLPIFFIYQFARRVYHASAIKTWFLSASCILIWLIMYLILCVSHDAGVHPFMFITVIFLIAAPLVIIQIKINALYSMAKPVINTNFTINRYNYVVFVFVFGFVYWLLSLCAAMFVSSPV